MDYLLFYDYSPDYLERRDAFRAEHLTLAWAAQAKGQLILAGAFSNPANGAVLHFQAPSPSTVEDFVNQDPYVRNGLVTRWWIRDWLTTVGDSATNPIHPDPK